MSDESAGGEERTTPSGIPVEPLYGPHGWRFGDGPGTIPDSVNGASELAEIYLRRSDPAAAR